MNNVIPFNYQKQDVRVVTLNDEPWFVASDLCNILGLSNVSMALKKLEAEEVTLNQIEGSHRPTNLVSESGFYRLVMRSDKVEAVPFQKWVTGEVLPSIRKTGGYGVTDPMQALSDPATMRGLLLNYSEKVLALEEQNAVLTVDSAALKRLAGADGTHSLTEAAKLLKLRPKDFIAWLNGHGWIYKRAGSATWLGYSSKTDNAYLWHKETTVTRVDGTEKNIVQVRITGKGMARLAKLFEVQGEVA